MPSPLILVTGATGQIGFELLRELAALGTVVAPPRSELDLSRPETIRAAVRQIRPAVIVNAGAYTEVDKAETERALCFAINAEAPGILAEEARLIGSALIHYSTDYVFDGASDTPYVESDIQRPSTYMANRSWLESARSKPLAGRGSSSERVGYMDFADTTSCARCCVWRESAESCGLSVIRSDRPLGAGQLRLQRPNSSRGYQLPATTQSA